MRLKGTSGGCIVQFSLREGSTTAGCPGLSLDVFWASPRMNRFHSLLGNLLQCSTTLPVKRKESKHTQKPKPSHINRTSCVLTCASFLLSFHWILLSRVWISFLYSLPPRIYTARHKPPHSQPSLLQPEISSLSVSSHVICYYPLIVFVVLCWTCSSKSMCFLYIAAQNLTQNYRSQTQFFIYRILQ